MPHIMGPDGKKKLSKRDGAKDVLDYIREGYLVGAMINCSCEPGLERRGPSRKYSHATNLLKFSLERVQIQVPDSMNNACYG